MAIDKRAPHVVNSGLFPNPGPYLARIVSNIDPMKQGSLEVELLRSVGNVKDSGQQTFIVRYLSPFYGVTPLDVTGTDPTEFNDTQKSYGFWAVPPDVGVTVMVIFVDSDPGQGFWIGCVQDALMNHMIPGIAATSAIQENVRANDDVQWMDVEGSAERYGASFLPVGEVNRKIFQTGKDTPNPDVESIKKPIHPIAERLVVQGTIGDPYRGVYTSSARRESPSNVYGWSTPGPIDKRKGAARGKIGRADAKFNKFVSRMGGHCIVMDDGDDRYLRKTRPWEGPPEYADVEKGEQGLVDFPKDEAFRIRTRKGAQILMHCSEDFIYIVNSRGTAYIELTSQGSIELYARNGVHVHSGADIGLHAARHAQVHAGGALTNYAEGDMTHETGGNHTLNAFNIFHKAVGDVLHEAGNYFYQNSESGHHINSDQISHNGNQHEWRVAGNFNLESMGGSIELKSENIFLTGTSEINIIGTDNIKAMGSNIDLLAKDGALRMQAATEATINGKGQIIFETGGEANLVAGSNMNIQAQGGQMNLRSSGAMNVGSSDDALNISSKGAMSMGSSAGALSLSSKGTLAMASSGGGVGITAGGGNLTQKGSEIHLNGDDPPAPGAPAPPGFAAYGTSARVALEAHGASSIGAPPGMAGGATTFPMSLTTFPGGSTIPYLPTAEPNQQHSNLNPVDSLSQYRDHTSPVVRIGGKQYNMNADDALHGMNYEESNGLGYGGGNLVHASWNFSNSDMSDLSPVNTARPVNRNYMPLDSNDWRKDQEFLNKVQELAGKYGLKMTEVLAVIAIESRITMNPSVGKHHVGLIQMGAPEARSVGTSLQALKTMSRGQQMEYVSKYFESRAKQYSGGRITSIGQLYLLVAAPAFAKKANQPDAIVYGRNTKAWHQNPKWRDGGPGGPINVRGITNAVKQSEQQVISLMGQGANQAGSAGGTSGPQSSPRPSGISPGAGGTNPTGSYSA